MAPFVLRALWTFFFHYDVSNTRWENPHHMATQTGHS